MKITDMDDGRKDIYVSLPGARQGIRIQPETYELFKFTYEDLRANPRKIGELLGAVAVAILMQHNQGHPMTQEQRDELENLKQIPDSDDVPCSPIENIKNGSDHWEDGTCVLEVQWVEELLEHRVQAAYELGAEHSDSRWQALADEGWADDKIVEAMEGSGEGRHLNDLEGQAWCSGFRHGARTSAPLLARIAELESWKSGAELAYKETLDEASADNNAQALRIQALEVELLKGRAYIVSLSSSHIANRSATADEIMSLARELAAKAEKENG